MSEVVAYEIMLDFRVRNIENIKIDYDILECLWAEELEFYDDTEEEDE